MKKRFVFNIDKCVGCHACVVACSIENKLKPHNIWREVSTANRYEFPGLPVFHYSLACSHCENPPCLFACPANAFSINKELNVVVHHPEKCLGCKYCTWACPYDAPKYDDNLGIITKCTFCMHRLEKSMVPACANHCPTGALSVETADIPVDVPERLYRAKKYAPSVRIIKKRNCENGPEQIPEQKPISKNTLKSFKRKRDNPKIKLKEEWPLLIFTFIAPLLFGMMFNTSTASGNTLGLVFFMLGVTGLILSAFHLGKAGRAYRSVLNLKSSWLSREVLSYGCLLIIGSLYFYVWEEELLRWLGIISGIALLVSIDMLYNYTIRKDPLKIHSAHVILTGLLFAFLFSGMHYAMICVLLVKMSLYVIRKVHLLKISESIRPGYYVARILFSLVIPLFLLITEIIYFELILIISIISGEVVDRIEYYLEIDFRRPQGYLDGLFSQTP